MPRIPEIFRLDGDDGPPDDRLDQELDGQVDSSEVHGGDDPWLEALEREAASHVIQGSYEWRCVRCDSDTAVQIGEAQWRCTACQGTDFYATPASPDGPRYMDVLAQAS